MECPQVGPTGHQHDLRALHAELKAEGLFEPSRFWIGKLLFWIPTFFATYLALLSRKPTEHERAVWHKAQAGGLDSIEDLIYALINTRRFIFVE